MGKYSAVASNVVEKLSLAEKKQAADLANEWNNIGFSEEVKQKYVYLTRMFGAFFTQIAAAEITTKKWVQW